MKCSITLIGFLGLLFTTVLVTGCAVHPPIPPLAAPVSVGWQEEGIASFHGSDYDGTKTASGEIYDMHDMTAAHPFLPYQTIVEVVNYSNGWKCTVRINDRGPYKEGRIIDLSLAAAKKIGLVGPGISRVRIEVIKLGEE